MEKYKLFHSFGLQLSVSGKTIALSFDNPNNMSNTQEDNEAIANLQQRLMEARQMLEQILVTKQHQVAMPTNISYPLIVIGSSHQPGMYHGVSSFIFLECSSSMRLDCLLIFCSHALNWMVI